MVLKNEPPLIHTTSQIPLDEMQGQVDYMRAIGYDRYLVGTTVGSVAVFRTEDNSLIRMLVNEGLSVYEAAFTNRNQRMALACDGGIALIYEMENFERVG